MANTQTLSEMLRLNIKDIYINGEFVLNIREFQNRRIRIRDSELTRIIKHLNPDNILLDGSEYPFIKDLIIVKIGKSVRRYQNLNDGVFKLTVFHDTKDESGSITERTILYQQEYKRLICSSSDVRNGKAIFINKDLFDKVNRILLCGISENAKVNSLSKFSSYYGLAATDSVPVSIPNGIVVIPDYKCEIAETFDIVTHNSQTGDFNISSNQEIMYIIKSFDGAGLIDIGKASEWAKELSLDHIPASFQFRMIPGIKGNLYTFDIYDFAREYNCTKIIDCWGKPWDLYTDKIDCIMTRSQFKFKDNFNELNDWVNQFKKPEFGYQRTFNIHGFAGEPRKLRKISMLSYQPIQTLSLTDGQIHSLCERSIKSITKAHNDLETFLKYRGIKDKSEDEAESNDESAWNRIPPYYRALKEMPALINDPYIKHKALEDLKGIKHMAYSGKVLIEGNYQMLIPDLFGLSQAAFGIEPTGLLQPYHIFSAFWLNHGSIKDDYIDVIRSPHIAQEHALAKLEDNDNIRRWFRHQTTGIVVDMRSSLPLKLNGADFDGDTVLTTNNSVIIDAARQQQWNTIVPIETNPNNSKVSYRIDDTKELIKTDCRGMSSSIGEVINKITTLWSLPTSENEIERNYIKILSVVGSCVIDFAKTGIKVDVPSEIKKFLKSHKKPKFMMYLKKAEIAKEATRIHNAKLRNMTNEEIAPMLDYTDRECTVNRISRYLQSMTDSLIPCFTSNQFDYHILLSDPIDQRGRNKYNATYPEIKSKLFELQRLHERLCKEQFHLASEDLSDKRKSMLERFYRFYSHCRVELMLLCSDVEKLLDYLVMVYYTDKLFMNRYHDKSILWSAFPDEMISRCKHQSINKHVDQNKLLKEISKFSVNEKRKKVKEKGYDINLDNSLLSRNVEKITVNKSEIDIIKDCSNNINVQKLLFTLLVLWRKFGGAPITICRNQRGKITQTLICTLANITSRQYQSAMQLLSAFTSENLQVVFGDSKSLLNISYSLILSEVNDHSGEDISICDLNQCTHYASKLFKKSTSKRRFKTQKTVA